MANSRKNNTTLKHLETDAFAIKFKTTCGEKYWVPVDIARKLERERDEAMEDSLEQARLLGMGSEREAKLISERDEAREQAERYRLEANALMLKVMEGAK